MKKQPKKASRPAAREFMKTFSVQTTPDTRPEEGAEILGYEFDGASWSEASTERGDLKSATDLTVKLLQGTAVLFFGMIALMLVMTSPKKE